MSSAVTAIANAATKPVPPASPFAELLRRSRFASYDPAIRQTYSSPPAHAHRGDWGLKRPINLRRRNAFVSLSSFESQAQFAQWNHAENQVRFVRRVEEMGVTIAARKSLDSPWHRGLGRATGDWVVDSEFCPGESHVVRLNSGKPAPMGSDLPGLGNRGPGQYGANRTHRRNPNETTQVTSNWDAMSAKDFQRYIRKLRALRPKFQQYLQSQDKFANRSLYEVAQDNTASHHTQFLLDHTAREFQTEAAHRQIEPQPHQNAGLMYAHPSRLSSGFMTEAQPGIVLQASEEHRFNGYSNPQEKYIVSFGGLGASVSKKNAGGKVPLFNFEYEQAVDRSKLDGSIAYMRVKSLELEQPPRVVGRGAQGVKAVKLRTEVVINSSHLEFGIENPHEPGTPEYIAAEKTPRSNAGLVRRNHLDARRLQQRATNASRDPTGVLTTLQDVVNVR